MHTETQRRNIAALYKVWNSNSDGELTWSDYQAVVDRLGQELGFGSGSDEYRSLTDNFRRDWDSLTRSADKDSSGSVDVNEWNAFHEQMVSTDDGFEQAVGSFADLMLSIADSDNDGVVTKEEYARILRAFGRSSMDADTAFDKLDSDNDDRISAAELKDAARQYFRPSGPDDAGNYVFGAPS